MQTCQFYRVVDVNR